MCPVSPKQQLAQVAVTKETHHYRAFVLEGLEYMGELVEENKVTRPCQGGKGVVGERKKRKKES